MKTQKKRRAGRVAIGRPKKGDRVQLDGPTLYRLRNGLDLSLQEVCDQVHEECGVRVCVSSYHTSEETGRVDKDIVNALVSVLEVDGPAELGKTKK